MTDMWGPDDARSGDPDDITKYDHLLPLGGSRMREFDFQLQQRDVRIQQLEADIEKLRNKQSSVDILHQELDALAAQGANWQRIMTAHALVAAGFVTAIECAMPRCIYETRELDPRTRSLALSIDHIIALSQGGTHRPENLRLAHLGCNSAATHHDESITHKKSITLKRTRRMQKYAKRNAELKTQVIQRDDVWLERFERESKDWLWLDSTRRLQHTVYHTNYEVLVGDKLADYMIWNAFALIDEVTEFMREVKWKNWATDRGKVNRDEAVGELVDVGHFLGNLLVVLGVTDVEWEVRYREKQVRNAERQQAPNGYSGDKCPKCYRELDRDGALVRRNTEIIGGIPMVHCAYCNTPIREYEVEHVASNEHDGLGYDQTEDTSLVSEE